VMCHNRQTVADIQSMKARGQKISMLYVTTLDEAAAAAAAGVTMLSIEGRFFSPEMREAAGRCFVQVGLPYGPFGSLATGEDYLRDAFRFMAIGGDCFYCAASLDIQKALCDNPAPVVAHVGLIPSQNTSTGGWKAVGKTADSAKVVWDHVKRLEAIGCLARSWRSCQIEYRAGPTAFSRARSSCSPFLAAFSKAFRRWCFGPLLFPVAKQLGVHEVHYAMVVILAMGIGLFSPPFGLGYYAACSIGPVDSNAALKRIWSYMAALVVGLVIVALVPWISTGFLR
jgi:hypothetical protein